MNAIEAKSVKIELQLSNIDEITYKLNCFCVIEIFTGYPTGGYC